ncbi:hypothetical protein EBZ39_04980 [bacterium]|nr:hypothetical protein [bacterium]
MYLVNLLVEKTGVCASVARRLIVQGEVKIDNKVEENPAVKVPPFSEVEYDGKVYIVNN